MATALRELGAGGDLLMNVTKFMGWLTLILLVGMMFASTWLMHDKQITGRDYLAMWTPLLTLAVGWWFGRQGPTT